MLLFNRITKAISNLGFIIFLILACSGFEDLKTGILWLGALGIFILFFYLGEEFQITRRDHPKQCKH